MIVRFNLFYVFCILLCLFTIHVSAQCNHDLGSYAVNGNLPQNSTTIDICFNTSLQFKHNRDHNFDGDSEASTAQGIGYFLFRNQPNSENATLTEIFTKFDVVRDADANPVGFFGTNGLDAVLINNEDLLTSVGTNPVYLAPVLFNNFESAVSGNFSSEVDCSAISGEFTLIQLMPKIEIEVNSFANGVLNIMVTGGTGGPYSYEIYEANLAGEAQVVESASNVITAGSTFEITIDDRLDVIRLVVFDQSCSEDLLAYSKDEIDDLAKVEIGCVQNAKKGDFIRVPIYIENAYEVENLTFELSFDYEKLRFREGGFGSNIPEVAQSELEVGFSANGTDLSIQSIDKYTFTGERVELLWIEFEVIGGSGDFASIDFVLSNTQSFANFATSYYSFLLKGCGVYIMPDFQNFTADASICNLADIYTFYLYNTEGVSPYKVQIQDESGGTVVPEFDMAEAGEYRLPNFSPGIYRVVITDYTQKSITKTISVTGQNLELDLSIHNPTCDNENGRIDIDKSTIDLGENLRIEFAGEGRTIRTSVTNFTELRDLSPGDYTFEVVDGLTGCRFAREITLENKSGATVEVEYDASGLFSCDSGEKVQVTIDVKDYQATQKGNLTSLQIYSCLNGNCGASVQEFSHVKLPVMVELGVGNYEIRVLDDMFCPTSKEISIVPESAKLVVGDIEVTPVCGRSTVSGSHNTARISIPLNSDYTNITIEELSFVSSLGSRNFTSDLNENTKSTVASQLVFTNDDFSSSTNTRFYGGVYTLQISHPDFCVGTQLISFEVPEVTFDSLQVLSRNSCGEGEANGSVEIMIVDGSYQYEIFWDTSPAETLAEKIPLTGYVKSGLLAGEYRFQLREEKSKCLSQLNTVRINEGAGINIVDVVQPTCPGSADGEFVVEIDGDGSGMIDLLRIERAGTVIYEFMDVVGRQSIMNLNEGDYQVFATLNECENNKVHRLVSPHDGPTLGSVDFDNPICSGDPTIINISPSSIIWPGNNKSLVRFGVNFRDENTTYSIGQNHSLGLSTGVNNLYLYDGTCWSRAYPFEVVEPAEIVPTIEGDSVVYLGQSVELSAKETHFVSYNWLVGEEMIMGERSVLLTPSNSGVIRLEVSDVNGCSGQGEFFVLVIDNKELGNPEFPNVFSPTLDGSNGYFRPLDRPSIEQVLEFKIFDRWGNRIWEDKEIANLSQYDGWDGKTLDGQNADAGVYIFTLKVRYLDQEVRLFRDEVTLVR